MKKTAVFAAAALFLFTAAALPSPAAGPSLAPLNPAFLRDRALPGGGEAELRRSVFFAGERRPSGKRPSPLNLDHLRGRGETVRYLAARTFREDAAFPSRFDLREQGKLSPIRDQDPYGTCWTFAAMAALESSLLPGEPRDFSEWHLAYWAYRENPEGFPPFTLDEEVALFDQPGDAAAAGRAGPAVGAEGLAVEGFEGCDDAGLEVEEVGFDGGAVRHGEAPGMKKRRPGAGGV